MQAGVVVSENHGQNIFNTQGGRALQHIAQQDFTHADPAHIVSDINRDLCKKALPPTAEIQTQVFVYFRP